MTSRNDRKRPDNAREILDNDTLTPDEKEAQLEDLRLDLIGRQRATEENMPRPGGKSGDVGDRLQEVDDALRRIGDETGDA